MPTNILKLINDNIVAMSEDLNKMHAKIDELYSVFYSGNSEGMPKTDGAAPIA